MEPVTVSVKPGPPAMTPAGDNVVTTGVPGDGTPPPESAITCGEVVVLSVIVSDPE